MTDTNPSAVFTSLGVFDGNPQSLPMSPADAVTFGVLPLPAHFPGAPCLLDRGRVMLDASALRRLRQSRYMSQQDLADDCWRRNIRVSLPTIKRAELGRPVLFRIARELARCFDVPVVRIVRV